MNAITPLGHAAEPETLTQFLSRAPLGLLQTTLDGSIEMVNPMAAGLLAPLSSAGRLDNLFGVLGGALPRVRALVAAFDQVSGTVCESMRVPLVGPADAGEAKALYFSLFKLDAARLLAIVSDRPCEHAVQEGASRRRGMARELGQALADNELFVQYQPVVGLREYSDFAPVDRSAGVEVLVRWNHRIRGAVSPLELISLAEEYGLIGALGDFVLGTACRQFVQWGENLGARAPRFVAVNLSRGQLAQPGFVDSVRNILQSSGMDAGQLQLEVHESLVAQDAAVQTRLRELKGIGLRLALDNFGTGYSSLVNLHLLPVDVIKIDRSFVREAVGSAHHRVLIEATVRVANSLDMKAGAEGIETEAQLAMVQDLGCETGQGYFFSEPISAPKVAQWLTAD